MEKMATRGEIFYIFLAAFKSRISQRNCAFDRDFVLVCLMIEVYDRCNHGRALLGNGTYIRAVPQDCSNIIFKSLTGTRWDAEYSMRLFVGRKPRQYPREGSGIANRPCLDNYSVTTHGEMLNIFYGLELVFGGDPGKCFAFLLCGHNHNNGIVLSGRSAEIFEELWAGAVALAGPMIIPQCLRFRDNEYVLEYWCRGYLLAKTFIRPGLVRTYYFAAIKPHMDFPTTDNIYSLDVATPEYKRRIFAAPLL